MGNRWHDEDHGPGQDGSWPGGMGDAARPHGAAPSPRVAGPEFGVHAEQVAGQEAQPQWRPSFEEPAATTSRPGGRSAASLLGQLPGLAISMLSLVLFAVIAYRMGMDLWWIFLGVGIPLLARVVRVIRRNLRP